MTIYTEEVYVLPHLAHEDVGDPFLLLLLYLPLLDLGNCERNTALLQFRESRNLY